MNKPSWWLKNSYPPDIFPMPREEYEEIVPDPGLRTGLSGMLGREFWNIASEAIWNRLISVAMEEENDEVLRFLGAK